MTLTVLIATARRELRAETPVRIHTGHAPKLLDADGVTSHYPDEGGIGLPFTAEFHRLLALRERFSQGFLLRLSLLEVGDWCASKHPEHEIPDAKPLCAQLAYATVVGGADPALIALLTGRRLVVIEGLLTAALGHAASWRIEQEARAGFVENAQAETVAERLRREHDVRHEERAWLLTRTKYSALPSWDIELAARAEAHRKMGCEGCPLGLDRAA